MQFCGISTRPSISLEISYEFTLWCVWLEAVE